jgi:hypothetical protein
MAPAGACALLAGVCAALAGASAATLPATTSVFVPFSDVGFENTIVLGRGAPRTFSVYFPVYPQLRAVTLVLPMHIAPIVDPASSIAVSVQGAPVYTQTVRTLGTHPDIVISLPVPAKRENGLMITVTANLFVYRNHCRDDTDPNFWATIDRAGGWKIVADTRPPADIADWFASYANDVTVVVPPNAPPEIRAAAPRIAYALGRIPRWRKLQLHLADREVPGARNAVLTAMPDQLRLRDRTLDVAPAGIDVLRPALVQTFQTRTVRGAHLAAPPPTPATRERTLADLGIPDETRTGMTHDVAFAVPFSLADVTGMPEGLVFIIGLTHSATTAEQRPQVNVSVNGTLVRSFDLAPQGGTQTFAVPLPRDDLQAANTIQIAMTTAHSTDTAACIAPHPFVASLLRSSRFTWGRVTALPGSIGDFFVGAHGTLALYLADPADIRPAFNLMALLGAVNDRLAAVTVAPFTGSVPAGSDEAAVVGDAASVAVLKPEFIPGGDAFELFSKDGHRLLYRANYDRPFGVLETLPGSPPTLVATYAKDRTALDAVATLSPHVIAAQVDTLFIFARTHIAYGATDRRLSRIQPPPNPFLWILLGGLAAIVIGVATAIVIGTRRRTPRAAAAPTPEPR